MNRLFTSRSWLPCALLFWQKVWDSLPDLLPPFHHLQIQIGEKFTLKLLWKRFYNLKFTRSLREWEWIPGPGSSDFAASTQQLKVLLNILLADRTGGHWKLLFLFLCGWGRIVFLKKCTVFQHVTRVNKDAIAAVKQWTYMFSISLATAQQNNNFFPPFRNTEVFWFKLKEMSIWKCQCLCVLLVKNCVCLFWAFLMTAKREKKNKQSWFSSPFIR